MAIVANTAGSFNVDTIYGEGVEKINVDKNFLSGILSLRGKRLAWFCKPKPCHCDVIVEFLDNHDNC